jgi:hypothetical protein
MLLTIEYKRLIRCIGGDLKQVAFLYCFIRKDLTVDFDSKREKSSAQQHGNLYLFNQAKSFIKLKRYFFSKNLV